MYTPCRVGQLRGRAGRGGPAGGTIYQQIKLINISNTPCTLSGHPAAVVGVRPDGQQVTLVKPSKEAAGANLIGPGPANVRPGRAAWLTLASADACDARLNGEQDNYSTMRIALRNGHRIRVTFAHPINVICGLFASGFGEPWRAVEPTSRWAVLTAHAHFPARLTPGSVLHYTVTLTNRSRHDLSLSPCPSYAEYLTPTQALQKRVVERYFLNCQASPLIPARGSVTFAMQMRVPEATGPTKYGWQIQASNVGNGGATNTQPS